MKHEVRIMYCIRCGLTRRGKGDFFICEDCQEFSEIVKAIYRDVNNIMESSRIIDPDTMPILRFLADSSFITSKNPQMSIFHKISDLIISKAFSSVDEISEEELNREIETTRSWRDVFKIFEELDLIKVKTEGYQRLVSLTEKTKKMASQFLQDKPISDQVEERLAHIYSGYVLLYLLTKLAEISDDSELDDLPYNRRPRTLWIILMFLWSSAYEGKTRFTEEDMRKFVSRRRIPSSTRGKIVRALQSMDGTVVQGLIKNVSLENNEKVFEFEDYAVIEMERVRNARERER